MRMIVGLMLMISFGDTSSANQSGPIINHEQLDDDHFVQSNYQEALINFTQAYKQAITKDDVIARIRNKKNIGITHRLLGQFELALNHLEQASIEIQQQLSYETSNETVSLSLSILGNLGTVYKRMGALKLAQSIYEKALNISIKHQLDNESRDLLLRLGELYLDSGNVNDALSVIKHALDDYMDLNNCDLSEVSWTYTVYGSALYANGNYHDAIKFFELAADNYQQLDMTDAYFYRLLDLAKSWKNLNEKVANYYFNHIIENAQSAAILWQALTGLAEHAAEQTDSDLSITYYEKALIEYHKARSMDMSFPEKVSLNKQVRKIVKGLSDQLLIRDNPGDLIKLLNLINTEVHLNSLLQTQHQQKNFPVDLNLQSPNNYSSHTQQSLDHLYEHYERAELNLQKDAQLRFYIEGENIDFSKIQSYLNQDEALIQYYCGRTTLLIAVIKSHEINHTSLNIDCKGLSLQSYNIKSLLESEDSDLYKLPVQNLYQHLITPIEEQLVSVNHLSVINGNGVRYLPFEVLYHDDRFLIEDYSIEYFESLSQFSSMLEKKPINNNKDASLLFIGKSKGLNGDENSFLSAIFSEQGLQLNDLPSVKKEMHVVKQYAGLNSSILLDNRDSENHYKKASLNEYSIIHFATHGLMSARRSERSALLLNASDGQEDGFLQAWEIIQYKLRSQLVILSACTTALLAGKSDFGALSLPNAFISAGAQSIIGTLWKIDDETPLTLMEGFYRNLSNDDTIRNAIQKAKIKLINQPSTTHPKYWSAFILMGNGRQTIPLQAQSFEKVMNYAAYFLIMCGVMLLLLSQFNKVKKYR